MDDSDLNSDACAEVPRLEAERLRIQREITAYPMPIAACDAFFNHLLEERARVCEALAAHVGEGRRTCGAKEMLQPPA